MDILDIIQAVKKAIKHLEKSGKVGYVSDALLLSKNEEAPLDEDLFGLYVWKNPNSIVKKLYMHILENPDLTLFVRLQYGTTLGTYKCKLQNYNAGSVIGNLRFVGGEDTGEPFAYYISDSGDMLAIENDAESVFPYRRFSITIEVEDPKVHTIDPKFIPGAVLPVVELSTVVTMDGQFCSLSETESELLDATYRKKSPIVCNCTIGQLAVSVPMMYVAGLGSDGYSGLSPVGNLSLTNNESRWVAVFEIAR